MFTGLVEVVGSIARLEPRSGSLRIGIATPPGSLALAEGDSLAVDGVCLTVTEQREGHFEADVVAETLARTTLGGLAVGHRVNLERALRLGDRLGGHLVQGHVDATTRVQQVERRGDDCRLRLALVPEIAPYVALKGSIAVSGVSLTVCGLGPAEMEIALVPFTLERTNLGSLTAGERVNVEVDLLARYLERLMSAGRGSRESNGGG